MSEVLPDGVRAERLYERAIDVLNVEAEAVLALRDQIGPDFARACAAMLACRGRVVVSGIGKSGHVARKIAATLASTGTPAFFVHPAEASHGDLGMITKDDVFLALSNSGKTEELLRIVPLVKRMGTTLLSMTGAPTSPLATLSDVHLYAGARREACPLNLAPTASTTAALAMGDALAVALLEARGFGSEDFARSHPGGALGRQLLTRVCDVMRQGDEIPRARKDDRFSDALVEMTQKRMGMVAVVDASDRVIGIFTDGDLRRLLERLADPGKSEDDGRPDLARLTIGQAMHADPVTTRASTLAAEVVRTMEERRISQILVTDDERHLVGAVHFHDLLKAKVV